MIPKDSSTNTTLVKTKDDWMMISSAAYIGAFLISQSGKASVDYGYSSGDLSTITRNGYITSGGTEKSQTYRFAYDDFGNRTSVSVGNRQLAGYTYNSGNGTMSGMTYGSSSSPLATVSYGYDKLDRVKTVTYHDTNSGENTTYGYNYSADGSLAGITEDNELKYTYEYDSLGRLIYSSRLEDGKTKLYTSHQYDTSDRLTEQSWQIGNDSFTESYAYSNTDGTLSSMTTGGDTLGFTYNSLKQLSGRTSPKLDIAYGYRTRNASDKLTTNQVETVQYLTPGTTTQLLPTLKYTYDSLWNITKVESGTSTTAQYTYDEQNQLTREVIPSKTADYIYDTYGNIRSKANTYTDGSTDSYTFSYENSDWLDLLTKVTYTDKNGSTTSQSLTYDAIGNPLSYFNGKESWSFTWKNGRQLAGASNGSETITNTYDVDGIRETKTVNGVTHTYTTLSDKIVREVYGTTTIDYLYDNDGRPYKVIIDENGTTYTGYFVLNLQGDVIAIIDQNGAVAVQYKYDAWGKQVSYTTSGTYGSKLYGYNALKYRGYYYDAETGFYYVSSRYYDPEVGRFISADGEISGVGGEILGYNLYAYCQNNPINMSDPDGNWPKWATKVAVGVGVALCVAAVAVLTCGVGTATLAGAVAVGAAKGTLIGAAAGTAIGAGVGYKKTKTLKGAAKGASIGFGIGASVGAVVGGGVSGAKFGTFSSKASLTQHFDKHGSEFKGTYDNVKEYAEGAKYVIKNGTYIPEKNAYVRFLGSKGKANYAFVGMKSGGRVSTFHVRSVSSMAKDGITLFVK